MSKVVDCQKLLIAESEKKGFLTFDDIMDVSDTYSLSVSEVDQLSEALEIRGIIIYETAPSGSDIDYFEDYSRIDYEAIFKEVVSLSPELEYIVDLMNLVGYDAVTLGNHEFDKVIKIPEINKFLSPILSVVPLQLLAYHIAKAKMLDVDKPRNLAKSVTVE